MSPERHLALALLAVGGDVDDLPDEALGVIGLSRIEAVTIARLLQMSDADFADYGEALRAEVVKVRAELERARELAFDAELDYWRLGGDVEL